MDEGAVLLESLSQELRRRVEDEVIMINGEPVWPLLVITANGYITIRIGQKTAHLDGATLRDGEIRIRGDQLPLGPAVVSQADGRIYIEPIRERR